MKKQDKSFTFQGKYFFLVVFILYVVLFLGSNQIVIPALQKSWDVMVKIAPIFIIVILVTALFNYFLQPRQIARHFGCESGVKAWLWALAAGVVSHGPMYVWYPVLEDLRSHGMRDGLVVVFFASRAIKIPLLPIMIDYFGWVFTIILSFYILAGALIQGFFLEKLDN